MDRRSFLSLPAGAAVAASLPAQTAQPSTRLHQVLMAAKDNEPIVVFLPTGRWRVIWTGWNLDVTMLRDRGVWFAIWDDYDTRNEHFGVYVASPGGWGQVNRRAMIDLDVRFPQPYHFTSEGTEESKEKEKAIALSAFLELLSAHDWKDDWPQRTGNDRAWHQVSSRTKFYLDYRQWFTEVAGESPIEYERAIEQARAFGFDTSVSRRGIL